MASIELMEVTTAHCLDKVNIKILDGELLVLLGPTGAGKTTLLNVIAGLEEYQGIIKFNGVSVEGNQPMKKQQIGYLFQEYNLFPHLNVYSNISFGLRMKKQSEGYIKEKVSGIMDLLNISGLASRYPRNLSGGEKQRVALARALAVSPSILLLDEPMSSLDHRTSKYMRSELKSLQKKMQLTTVYVTHDFYEAEEMADRIAVVDRGMIVQVGLSEDIFFSGADMVRDFMGSPNILICEKCRQLNENIMEARCGDITLVIANEGKPVKKLAVLPEDIHLSATRPPGPDINRIAGVLLEVEQSAYHVCCTVQAGNNRLRVRLAGELFHAMNLKTGDPVWLVFNLRKLKIAVPEQ